ncbi:hypothetical protein [Methylobacterium sp. NPDC015015]
MSAAGGDRHFAPGAAYRHGGFDETHWMREVNKALTASRPFYQVSPYMFPRGEVRRVWQLRHHAGANPTTVTVLTSSIQPEHTSIQALEAMIDVHERALKQGARDERARLQPAPEVKRAAPRGRTRRAAPEEAAAPGMRP